MQLAGSVTRRHGRWSAVWVCKSGSSVQSSADLCITMFPFNKERVYAASTSIERVYNTVGSYVYLCAVL